MYKMYCRNNRDGNELAGVVSECNSLTITAEAKDFYINEMEMNLRANSNVDKEKFHEEHRSIKAKTLEMVFFVSESLFENICKYCLYSSKLNVRTTT